MGFLMTCGGPHHMLAVLKVIRQQTGKESGDMLQVEVGKDEASRTLEVPAPFEKLLKREGPHPFFCRTELNPPQGILPLDCRGQKGRDTIEEIGESH